MTLGYRRCLKADSIFSEPLPTADRVDIPARGVAELVKLASLAFVRQPSILYRQKWPLLLVSHRSYSVQHRTASHRTPRTTSLDQTMNDTRRATWISTIRILPGHSLNHRRQHAGGLEAAGGQVEDGGIGVLECRRLKGAGERIAARGCVTGCAALYGQCGARVRLRGRSSERGEEACCSTALLLVTRKSRKDRINVRYIPNRVIIESCSAFTGPSL